MSEEEIDRKIDEARKFLSARFDSFVITAKIKDENNKTQVFTFWHADITDALGMARIGVLRTESHITQNLPIE